MKHVGRVPSPGLEQSPFYEPRAGEMPDVLKAWELDPSFRSVTRAALSVDHPEEFDFATVRSNANLLLKSFKEESNSHSHSQCETAPFLLSPVSPAKNLQAPSPKPSSPCPMRPYHLTRTHLKLTLTDGWTLEQLVHAINISLQSFSEYDFSFENGSHMWKGKYLQGSLSCIIHLQLYSDIEKPNDFIVEAVRASGDSKPFNEFFREFKHILSESQTVDQTMSTSCVNNCGNDNLGSSCYNMYSDEYGGGQQRELMCSLPVSCMCAREFLQSIQPILKMAKSQYFEVKLEGARMLCDLSLHDPAVLGDRECLHAIVHALERLIMTDYFAPVREQAIIALGAFTDVPGYGNVMATSEVLSTLLALVDNPPSDQLAYESAQVRRECARIVCAVAVVDPRICVNTLRSQHFPLRKWMECVSDICDPRMKMHAQKIYDQLSKVI